ncbi:MAG: hypothetical protein WBB73_00725 [Candidatus Aminicenantaceae bacterium]
MKTMYKKYLLVIFGLFVLVAFLGAAKEKTIMSQWNTGEMKIDGMLIDWPEVESFVDSKTKADVGFVNDGTDLYIRVIFNDPKALSSIQYTGLKVWLNSGQKKAGKFGFHLMPKHVTALEMIALMEKEQGPLSDSQKSTVHQKAPFTIFEGKVIDKKGQNTALTPLGDGLRAANFRTFKSNGSLIYEIRVPFMVKELGMETSSAPLPLLIGFEWGGMTKEMREAMMRQRSEQATSANQGTTRFETRGDDSDEAPVVGDTNQAFQRGSIKHTFWVSLMLAKQ